MKLCNRCDNVKKIAEKLYKDDKLDKCSFAVFLMYVQSGCKLHQLYGIKELPNKEAGDVK